jgi:DNA invertase Pin-like site-specific DNA recombinase
MSPAEAAAPAMVRCVIYTRKSSEEGLSQEFNSLDAQRECAEAYILSQRQEGWTLLPQHYNDGGFSGATLVRPALQRLLEDVQGGQIDCVVVYKVDRLSRSLFDFARLMRIFDQHGVSFVSVTQQLNSSTPMGRLTLNVLLSFSEFEREIIRERTRDKKAASRRKGQWMGGYPVLGYDVKPGAGLAINVKEAEQVREIFALYLCHGSLIATVAELQRRGWRMKSWTTRKGQRHTGRVFDRAALKRLLTNVVYRGEVRHEGQRYGGQQAAIVDGESWEKANELLQQEPRTTESRGSRQPGLLKDLLDCGVCGSRMVLTACRKKGRQYRYYVCQKVPQQEAEVCPGPWLVAQRIEQAVVARIHELASAWPPWKEALQEWAALELATQQARLSSMVEHIGYDSRSGQATLRWRGGPMEREEITIQVARTGTALQTGTPRPAAAASLGTEPRLPRITRLLALAVRFEELLQRGTVRDYAELARLGGVSRSRITQVMNLRSLAPAIQEEILLQPSGSRIHGALNERLIRRVMQHLDWREQMRMLEEIVARRKTMIRSVGRNSGDESR